MQQLLQINLRSPRTRRHASTKVLLPVILMAGIVGLRPSCSYGAGQNQTEVSLTTEFDSHSDTERLYNISKMVYEKSKYEVTPSTDHAGTFLATPMAAQTTSSVGSVSVAIYHSGTKVAIKMTAMHLPSSANLAKTRLAIYRDLIKSVNASAFADPRDILATCDASTASIRTAIETILPQNQYVLNVPHFDAAGRFSTESLTTGRRYLTDSQTESIQLTGMVALVADTCFLSLTATGQFTAGSSPNPITWPVDREDVLKSITNTLKQNILTMAKGTQHAQ